LQTHEVSNSKKIQAIYDVQQQAVILSYPSVHVIQDINTGVRARGLGAAAPPPDSGKTIIFRAKANFFRAEASSQK